ncbi:hypothetical protein MASR1M60_28800 [Rhodocyclaceae bacterium]
MAISSVQSATAYGSSQLQKQAAQRNAQQLEARAQSLAAAADDARKVAEAATRQADRLGIEAGTAKTAATNANLAVAASESAVRLGKRIGEQADRIYQTMQSGDDRDKLYGRNGRTSGSSYSAGSLFKLAG